MFDEHFNYVLTLNRIPDSIKKALTTANYKVAYMQTLIHPHASRLIRA